MTTPFDCEFEADILAASAHSHWTPDLRAHANTCPVCSEVALVAAAIATAHDELQAPSLPDSGRMWRLAQLRARREAAQGAGRPITAAQVIAFACAMGLLGACFGATSDWFQGAVRKVASGTPSVEALIAGHGFLLLAAAALVFLVPAVVFLTLLRD